jgi:hypothetical protein
MHHIFNLQLGEIVSLFENAQIRHSYRMLFCSGVAAFIYGKAAEVTDFCNGGFQVIGKKKQFLWIK